MRQKLIGILGGMGPFASAEFVNTIYEQNLGIGAEQNKPRLVLCSDPDIPDRSTSIQAGERDAVTTKLISLWELLNGMGIDRLIVPCITSHYYIDQYPEEMREQLVDLVELTLDAVERSTFTYLLFATTGTYGSGLLRHPRIITPTLEHQKQIHQLAYTLKQYGGRPDLLQHVQTEVLQLVEQYGAQSWISGCTEFHLLTRYVMRQREELLPHILDPLLLVAKSWPQFAVEREVEWEERG